MSDKSDDSDKKKGLFINAKGVSCIPCKLSISHIIKKQKR